MSRTRRHPVAATAVAICVLALLPAELLAGDRASPLVQRDSRAAPADRAAAHYTLDHRDARRTAVRAVFPDGQGRLQHLQFSLDRHAEQDSMRAFGVSARELQHLQQRCAADPGCDRTALEGSLLEYYADHQLRLRQQPGRRPRLFVDIPAVVSRDTHRVRAAADALRELAQAQDRDQEWLLHAAVALVQVGLAYRAPARESEGRQTLGFYTPVKALANGYGDCDTKSALLAALLRQLGDWKLIGVRVPDHYLLGIAREPRAGEAYLEHDGERYVLVEAAGPAHRLPGDVADRTRVALASGEEIRIDPLF